MLVDEKAPSAPDEGPQGASLRARAALAFGLLASLSCLLPGGLAPVASAARAETADGAALRARTVTRTFVYRGWLATRIHYYNACGADLGENTTNMRIRVVVSPPLRPTPASPGLPRAVGRERNVLHLSIGSANAAANLAPGFISLASALRFGATSPPVILQYWKLKLRKGKKLSGRLVEDHREEAAAINLLSAPQELVGCRPQFGTYPNAFPIAEGATLKGKVTTREIELRIRGSTVDRTRPFVAGLSAGR